MLLLWRHLYLDIQLVSAVLCPAVFFYQVLNCIVSYKKSEQVQQANMFKRQTLTFHFFQRVVEIHLNIYPITRHSGRHSTALSTT